MKKSTLLLFPFLLILLSSQASAWCIIGIGNTCGSDSRESSFLGQYFNFNKAAPTDKFDVWGIGNTVSKAFDGIFSPKKDIEEKPENPPYTPIKRDNDRITSYDSKGDSVITTFSSVSSVNVGAQDPWYYDLDVVNIRGYQCIGCPVDQKNLPGFDYEILISIKNNGNVPADVEFPIEVIGEDGNTGELYYNEVIHRPGFPVGTGDIRIKLYNIGYDPINKKILDRYIDKGIFTSDEIDFKVTVKIIGDDAEVEPGFVEYAKNKRICNQIKIGEDEDGNDLTQTSCKTETEIVKEIIHATITEGEFDDTAQLVFPIKRLSPDVAGDATLGIYR